MIDPEQYIPLVCHLAIRHGAPRGDAVKDSEQFADGMVGLLRACRSFDPGRGVKFISYAWYAIARAIDHDAYRVRKRKYTTTPELSGYNQDEFPGRELLPADSAEQRDAVARAFRGIPRRDRYVVEQTIMYGRTLGDVGNELGFSRERCRQIRKRALDRMRERVSA